MKNLRAIKGGFTLGETHEVHNGFVFVPRVAGRKSSRKAHPTAAAALPRWARKQADVIREVD